MAVADKYVNNEESFTMERELELAKAPEKRKEEVRSTNANVLYEIRGKEDLQWPSKMKGTGRKRNTSKYCHFHGDHGQTTDDCYNLKNEVERLVGHGRVDKYLLNSKHNGRFHIPEIPKTINPSNPTQPIVGNDPNRHIFEIKQLLDISIDVIAGGLTSGGPTISGQKAYATQIHAVEAPTKKLRSDPTDSREQIVFSEKDYDDVSLPHDNAIVVRLIIANFSVSKVMIDTGSSVNILHYNAFKEMHLGLTDLHR
ncbi:uncharacterized protein LOC143855942 [Tasmannia lanceolata]|uniref:uncharacterized protein LOC143855942 n=1 Tax=Tasmannia lanceolata TaxID=3420 RepID=UPI0040627EFF